MRSKSQGITEYALFIAAVIAAILALRVYFMGSYSGYHKKYSDSLSQDQFSAKYSDYQDIKETRSFNMGILRGEAVADENYFSMAVTGDSGQVTETHSGEITPLPLSDGDSDSGNDAGVDVSDVKSGAMALDIYGYSASFADFVDHIQDLTGDYTVSDTGTVVDKFSDKKLSEDEIWE